MSQRKGGEREKGKTPARTGTSSSRAGSSPLARRTSPQAKAAPSPVVIDVDGMAVQVTRKRIKNLNLRVKADGQVQVSAPLATSEAFIRGFVREKAGWIEARRAALAESPAALAAAASPEEVAQWREVVQACVPVLVEAWEPIIGVRAGKLAYRNMTSRWGSCQPATGRICINVRLALYPPECLEYVVVHELCHLKERGHGPAFQALMTRYLPDWKQRRAKLR